MTELRAWALRPVGGARLGGGWALERWAWGVSDGPLGSTQCALLPCPVKTRCFLLGSQVSRLVHLNNMADQLKSRMVLTAQVKALAFLTDVHSRESCGVQRVIFPGKRLG